jgi:hypothetical protein
MHSARASLVAGAVLTVAGSLACGGNNGGSTTTPENPPVTTTTTTTLPGPGACSPTPPPLMDFLLEIKTSDGHTRTLKATPRVPNTDGYCDRVGYGAYKFCNVRRDADPQKAACEGLAVGQAGDTGRWGPTWKYSLHYEPEHLCAGTDPGCTNHASDQYLLITNGAGTFFACASPLVPLSTDPTYPGSRCTRCVIDNSADNSCN